jgi:hypothetical protein
MLLYVPAIVIRPPLSLVIDIHCSMILVQYPASWNSSHCMLFYVPKLQFPRRLPCIHVCRRRFWITYPVLVPVHIYVILCSCHSTLAPLFLVNNVHISMILVQYPVSWNISQCMLFYVSNLLFPPRRICIHVWSPRFQVMYVVHAPVRICLFLGSWE